MIDHADLRTSVIGAHSAAPASVLHHEADADLTIIW
jgi:hypothetical protein